jgi:sec-independent protein translocase protein TatC
MKQIGMPPKPEDEAEPGFMTFWEHLEELRTRIVRAALAFIVGSCIAWYFRHELLLWITQPFVEGWGKRGEGPALYFPAPAALFLAYLKMSIMGGGVLALPFILHQLWSFVAPGLYSSEKRYVIPFVFTSSALFIGGAYFGWKVVFPPAFQYLLDFQDLPPNSPLRIEAAVMVDQYLEFMIQALVAFGAVAEVPIVVVFLAMLGIVNYKQLWKFFRYFVVVAFTVSAIITPPDPMSQILVALPVCLLYLISIGIAYLVGPKPAKT